ncbi:MAG: hypothetical protein ACKV2O_04330, partial [Acidimicrobiales bacterium]
RVNHKRDPRVVAELGLEGESGRRRVRTAIVDKGAVAAEDQVRTELVADAPTIAVATRCGHVPGVVFTSDRGSVYTSRI